MKAINPEMTTDPSIKTVLVTGAAGLIGSAVVRLLISQDIRVVACDNFSIGEWRSDDSLVRWEQVDITNPLLFDRLNTYAINAVVHCAAHPGGRSLSEPVEDVKVNALGSMQLFEWCARTGIPIVYLSSSAVYGHQPYGLILEDAPLNPGTIYAVCKVASENFLQILGEGYGLKWTVLRLFPTYGSGHKPSTFQGIVNVMLTQLLSGNKVVVRGSLNRERDLVYIDDAASAIVKSLLTNNAQGHIINIGTGTPVSILSLIETLSRVLGRQFTDIEIIEEAGTVGDPFSNVADCTKSRNILGFIPRYDLERGLTELIKQRTYQKN